MTYESYDQYLDNLYEDLGNPFNWPGSIILKRTDPIAYQVGFSEWNQEQEQKQEEEGEE